MPLRGPILVCASLGHNIHSRIIIWCGLFSLHLVPDPSLHTPHYLFPHLSQLFLHTSQLFSSSSLMGPFHTSPHLNNFLDPPQWIHILAPFPPPFPNPPSSDRGLLNHSIVLHVHHPSLYEQHLDPKWNLFEHLLPWTFFKLCFILTERITIFYNKLNNVSFLHSSEPKINSSSPLVI
jgi:hypothetical protein